MYLGGAGCLFCAREFAGRCSWIPLLLAAPDGPIPPLEALFKACIIHRESIQGLRDAELTHHFPEMLRSDSILWNTEHAITNLNSLLMRGQRL